MRLASDRYLVFWRRFGANCTPSKRDTRLRYSPTPEIYFLFYHNELRARSSTSWDHFRKAQSALPLPSRYQHHINLLKTFDKLAKGCVSVAAR